MRRGGKIKAVLFDLDGTVIDTLDDLTDAVNYSLKILSRTALDRDTVRRFVGNGVGKLIIRALWYTEGRDFCDEAHPDYDKCLADFTAYYDEHSADKTHLYDGVKEMLAEVHALGLKTAVVTNKYDGAAQSLKSKMFPEVGAVVGVKPGISPKPSRDGVDRALEIIGALCDEAVYIGDGEVDIATAKNANLPMVAVTWGFRDRAVLEKLCPDAIIDRPCELVPTLKAVGLI